MEKYGVEEAVLKGNDGEERTYKVLYKWSQKNITDENGKIHYGVYEKNKLFYTKEEANEIINVIKEG